MMKSYFVLALIFLSIFLACSKQEPIVLEKPQLVYDSIFNYELRPGQDMVCFKWKSVKGATQYYLELTDCNDFESFQLQTFTSDTSICISYDELSCHNRLKWRVQALGKNEAKSEFSYSMYNIARVPGNFDFWCDTPVDIPVIINGSLQIPNQNLDTVFTNLPAVFSMSSFSSDTYILRFYSFSSFTSTFFDNVGVTVLEDDFFAPEYFTINGQDSVLVTGNVLSIQNPYDIDGIAIFGNNASGQITFVSAP